MLNSIIKLCIDDPRVKVPAQIKMVPTMIIGATGQILVGQNIFIWLQSLRTARIMQQQDVASQNSYQQRTPQQPQQAPQQQTQQPIQQHKNPLGFVASEMSGFSDMYAYTKTDFALPHSYQSCTDIDKNTIFTAPEKKKLPKDTHINVIIDNNKSIIQMMENRRREQDEEAKNRLNPNNINQDELKKLHERENALLQSTVERQQNALMNYDKI
jgi:hypothetical protein